MPASSSARTEIQRRRIAAGGTIVVVLVAVFALVLFAKSGVSGETAAPTTALECLRTPSRCVLPTTIAVGLKPLVTSDAPALGVGAEKPLALTSLVPWAMGVAGVGFVLVGAVSQLRTGKRKTGK